MIFLGIAILTIAYGVIVSIDIPIHRSLEPGETIELKLNEGDQLELSDSFTATASGCTYFLLDNRLGQFIQGLEAPRPIGWPCMKYSLSPRQELNAGRWIVQDGRNITLVLTGESGYEIQIFEQHDPALYWGIACLALAVWALVVTLLFRGKL